VEKEKWGLGDRGLLLNTGRASVTKGEVVDGCRDRECRRDREEKYSLLSQHLLAEEGSLMVSRKRSRSWPKS